MAVDEDFLAQSEEEFATAQDGPNDYFYTDLYGTEYPLIYKGFNISPASFNIYPLNTVSYTHLTLPTT